MNFCLEPGNAWFDFEKPKAQENQKPRRLISEFLAFETKKSVEICKSYQDFGLKKISL